MQDRKEVMMNDVAFHFHDWAIYMGTWIVAWTLLFYSAAAGFILALKGQKTGLQKILALFGAGIVIMMWLVAK
jgi:hypothetical protein